MGACRDTRHFKSCLMVHGASVYVLCSVARVARLRYLAAGICSITCSDMGGGCRSRAGAGVAHTQTNMLYMPVRIREGLHESVHKSHSKSHTHTQTIWFNNVCQVNLIVASPAENATHVICAICRIWFRLRPNANLHMCTPEGWHLRARSVRNSTLWWYTYTHTNTAASSLSHYAPFGIYSARKSICTEIDCMQISSARLNGRSHIDASAFYYDIFHISAVVPTRNDFI